MDCEQTQWVSNREFMERLTRRAVAERTPLSGGMDLTDRCNLNCIHCYIHSPEGRRAHKGDPLPTTRILSILDELAELGCLFFLITGGEPLLHPDFARIYRHAKRCGLMVTVFTNGTLVDEATVELFSEYPPRAVEITVYGATQATYEEITGVAGSYDRCMRGIHLLHEAGTTLCLKTMLMEQNKHEFYAIKQLAADLGARFRFDSGVTPTLAGELHPLHCRMEPEEIVRYEFEDADVTTSWVRFREYVGETRNRAGYLYQCGCGESVFHIDARGHLLPCMMARDVSYDLKRGSFATGWRDAIPQVPNVKSAEDTACRECPVLGLCGYCPPCFRAETGDGGFAPPYMCRLAQARLSEIDKATRRELPDANRWSRRTSETLQ